MGGIYSLDYAVKSIRPPDENAATLTKQRFNSIVKPLGSLGKMEDHFVKIAALTGSTLIDLSRKAVVVFCADNGIVAQGISQSRQDVTEIVANNMASGDACVCAMAKIAGADVIPVDIGVAAELSSPGILRRKVAYGTRDFSKEPAMTREQAVEALETGIELAFESKKHGYNMLVTGEMGIGNTTASAAVASVLMDKPVELVTGRGAGLSSERLAHKVNVIRQAIALHKPDPKDAIDVLSKVGGLDIAGIAGLCLGGAACGVPVVLDGFISGVAAIVASCICPDVKNALLPSHTSSEPGARLALAFLGLFPLLDAGFHLGEGTGAVATLPLYDMTLECYNHMLRFEDEDMEPYKALI